MVVDTIDEETPLLLSPPKPPPPPSEIIISTSTNGTSNNNDSNHHNNNNILSSSLLIPVHHHHMETSNQDDANEEDDLLSPTPLMVHDTMRKTSSPHVSFLKNNNHYNDDDDDDDDDSGDRSSQHHHPPPPYGTTTASSSSSLLKQRPASISTRDRTEDSILSELFADVKETIAEVQVEIIEVLHEDIITPIKPRYEGDHTTKLSAVALAVMVFYKVSGGPFGCEPTVKAAGPLFALLGFTLVPLFVSIPEALVTAELGSAYPEPSGAVAWVEEAFGPKASLLCGYFHWVSGATDNAIYPSLFLKYVASYLNSKAFFSEDVTRFVFTVAITMVLSLINYSGLHIVGNLSIIICIISMSPFIIMVLLSLPTIDPKRWWVMPDPSVVANSNDGATFDSTGFFISLPIMANIRWRPLLNNLFWNLNSFDVGASFAGEVHDPDRVFPRAMFLSVIFVIFSYLLPLLAALGAIESEQSDWDAGYFTHVAIKIGGSWLGVYTVLAAGISNIALFEAEMSGDAYQLMGMADRGLIPKWFTKRSRFGTPVNGIITGTIVIILMSVADFDQLVEMLNFAYSLSILLEYAAFIKLRFSDDDVHRPYRVPLNTFGCICMLIPPSLFLLFLLAIASRMTYIYFASLLAFGIVFQFFQKAAKHYNWIQYAEAPKRIKKKVASPTAL